MRGFSQDGDHVAHLRRSTAPATPIKFTRATVLDRSRGSSEKRDPKGAVALTMAALLVMLSQHLDFSTLLQRDYACKRVREDVGTTTPSLRGNTRRRCVLRLATADP
jgi:hypothetical protein